jgi:hypothetical protein
MKRPILLLVTLLLLFAPSALGQAPELNVKATCKARSNDAKIVKSPPDQSMTDCVRDEEAAKQELNKLWASTPVLLRNRCESDTRFLGMRSYLDVLSCIYIANDTKPGPKKDAERK